MPRRRRAVVSGKWQELWTPYRFARSRARGQRFSVREDPRLLGLPDPPDRLLFKGKNWRGRKRCGLGALQKMNAQGVARCFVQGQAEIIESHHLMEPACHLMEHRGQLGGR